MKFLKSENKTVFTLRDADTIAMEMINVFHGIQYFDDGKLLATPRPGYMSFNSKNSEYDIVPAYGEIYLSNEAGSNFGKKRSIKHVIAEVTNAFNRLNTWGLRAMNFSTSGDGQLTVAVQDSKCAIEIIVKNSARCSYSAQMTWLFTITETPYRYIHYAIPTPQTEDVSEFMMSATTIFMDYQLGELYPRSLSWPQLPALVTLLPMALHITDMLGIEAHVYYHFTGKLVPDTSFKTCHVPVVVVTTTETETKTEKKEHTHCSSCEVPLWGDFYVDAGKPVCKFCIHYGAPAMITLERHISTVTLEMAINSMKIGDAERKAVQHLLAHPPKVLEYDSKEAYVHMPFAAINQLYSPPYVSMHGLHSTGKMHLSGFGFEPKLHLITQPTILYKLL